MFVCVLLHAWCSDFPPTLPRTSQRTLWTIKTFSLASVPTGRPGGLGRLVAGLSPRRHDFDPSPFHVKFWSTRWHWDRFFSEYFRFSPSLSFHQCSILIFIHVLLLPEVTTGDVSEFSKKQWYFGNGVPLDRNVLALFTARTSERTQSHPLSKPCQPGSDVTGNHGNQVVTQSLRQGRFECVRQMGVSS
jgi:hypothetical protein